MSHPPIRCVGGLRRWHLAIPVVLCGIALVLFHRQILVGIGKWLDVGERPRAADYVMVLPGGEDRRPFVAAAMVRSGLATAVLTAETETAPANDEGLVPAADSTMRQTLLLRGIPAEQIHVLPGHSNSTWTDAVALAKFLREHPQSTVAIVTDSFHTRRSRWVFQKVLRDDFRQVFFVTAPLDTVSVDSWWTTEEGLSNYISEYFKLVIYVITEGSLLILVLGIAIPSWLGWKLYHTRSGLRPLRNPATPGNCRSDVGFASNAEADSQTKHQSGPRAREFVD